MPLRQLLRVARQHNVLLSRARQTHLSSSAAQASASAICASVRPSKARSWAEPSRGELPIELPPAGTTRPLATTSACRSARRRFWSGLGLGLRLGLGFGLGLRFGLGLGLGLGFGFGLGLGLGWG